MELAQTWRPELIPDLPDPSSPRPGGEIGEFAQLPPIAWDQPLATSPNSPPGFSQPAVLPPDSILQDWFDYARTQTEGADCYLAGSIIPIVGALLGRRVWTVKDGKWEVHAFRVEE